MNFEKVEAAENQLQLFPNELTSDQQFEVNTYVQMNNKIELDKFKDYERLHSLLKENGLEEFVEADYRLEEVTMDKEFNPYNEVQSFKCEITVNNCKGGIKLKYRRFNVREGKILSYNQWVWPSDVDFRNGKVTISSISQNYRAYKFSSVKRKIEEINEEALAQERYNHAVIEAGSIVAEDMKNKYPNTTVTEYFGNIKEGGDWVYRRMVKVEFKSGSYVEYKVFENGNKTIEKIVDKQRETIEQTMDRFNLQK